jgi:predicted Zn-dependent protease
MRQRRFLTVIIFALLFIVSCSTVPVTGRRQLNIVPESTINSMSFQQYDEVLKTSKLSNDQAKVQMLKRVGKRIENAATKYMTDNGMAGALSGYKWDFNLIDNDSIVNAWCMPGGKVAFYTGILPITRDENGMAVVMGHEVAHAIANHGAERMSQGLLAQLGGMALSEAIKNKPEETQNLFLTAYGVGAQVGVLLPYSRLQESEADKMGLIFMAMAGYNPQTAVDFWQRMANMKQGSAPPEFLSTHPSDQTRIQKIQSLLPEAMKYYEQSGK